MSVVPAEALVLKLQPPKWLLGPVLGSLRAARASSPVPSALQCTVTSSSVMMHAGLVDSSSVLRDRLPFHVLGERKQWSRITKWHSMKMSVKGHFGFFSWG